MYLVTIVRADASGIPRRTIAITIGKNRRRAFILFLALVSYTNRAVARAAGSLVPRLRNSGLFEKGG
jgi:hypothetical protein